MGPNGATGGIGAQLRAQRTRRGATQEDAAQAAALPVLVVDALESDDYASLGTPIRVKAYLRMYARGLQLDPEPLLFAYDQPPAPATTTPATAQPPAPTPTPATPAPTSPPAPAPAAQQATVPLAPPVPPHHEPPVKRDFDFADYATDEFAEPRRRWLLIVLVLAAAVALTAAVLALMALFTDGDTTALLEQQLEQQLEQPADSAVVAQESLPDTIVAAAPLPQEPEPTRLAVQVLDGSRLPHVMDEVIARLERLGYVVMVSGPARQAYASSATYYNPGYEQAARELVAIDPRFGQVLPNDLGLTLDVALHVVAGSDWADGPAFVEQP